MCIWGVSNFIVSLSFQFRAGEGRFLMGSFPLERKYITEFAAQMKFRCRRSLPVNTLCSMQKRIRFLAGYCQRTGDAAKSPVPYIDQCQLPVLPEGHDARTVLPSASTAQSIVASFGFRCSLAYDTASLGY